MRRFRFKGTFFYNALVNAVSVIIPSNVFTTEAGSHYVTQDNDPLIPE